jgi:uncharacterized protein
MATFLKILLRIIIAIILIGAIISILGYMGSHVKALKQSIIVQPTQSNPTDPYSSQNSTSPSVTVSNTLIPVEVAREYTAIQKGLSGRPYLDQNSGMLFVFPKASIYSFWMPDMNFPIDILWINNGRVVDTDENMTNVFDPANPRYYRPSSPAQFVLEINAGFIRRNNIRIGDPVTLNNI